MLSLICVFYKIPKNNYFVIRRIINRIILNQYNYIASNLFIAIL